LHFHRRDDCLFLFDDGHIGLTGGRLAPACDRRCQLVFLGSTFVQAPASGGSFSITAHGGICIPFEGDTSPPAGNEPIYDTGRDVREGEGTVSPRAQFGRGRRGRHGWRGVSALIAMPKASAECLGAGARLAQATVRSTAGSCPIGTHSPIGPQRPKCPSRGASYAPSRTIGGMFLGVQFYVAALSAPCSPSPGCRTLTPASEPDRPPASSRRPARAT